jgi:hypothetical protein
MVIDQENINTTIGKSKLIENIKILLYKEKQNIFERIDFDNDSIYQEPLLYAYFNKENRTEIELETILYGYTQIEKRHEKINIKTDDYGRVYLPNLGWIHTESNNAYFELLTGVNGDFHLQQKNKKANFKFEPLEIIAGTNIELLKYPIPLLNQFYYDPYHKPVEVEIEDIANKKKECLTNAWSLIKRLIPNQYKLIESVVFKNIIFNINPIYRNSFASLSANGIIFNNAYQENYNEVFFVDDIAHQSGHVIFYSLLYNSSEFYKIDCETIIETLHLTSERSEPRNLRTIFHALYTYYTTFICLDACLNASVFKDEKEHETLGRISFYLMKCYHDIYLLETHKEYKNGPKEMFTDKGLIIYNKIKSTFKIIAKKWDKKTTNFDMSNQPYNFTYSKFVELNPLKEEIC